MIEITGDLWEYRQPEDWVGITTNLTLRRDGKLVMGRGIAFEASQRYPALQKEWGEKIRETSEKQPSIILTPKWKLIAFPVKYHFRDDADINLILRSTIQLLDILPMLSGGRILLPRPGCGNGRLDYAEVEPLLRKYLTSDRFIVFNQAFRGDLKQR